MSLRNLLLDDKMHEDIGGLVVCAYDSEYQGEHEFESYMWPVYAY